ncbi:MAG TPA: hypothetical protein VEF89_31455 [Solirubrobacteraceae bacterium]|nr:hypothetical protein [Solirubrobacteraceae bacterium]
MSAGIWGTPASTSAAAKRSMNRVTASGSRFGWEGVGSMDRAFYKFHSFLKVV